MKILKAIGKGLLLTTIVSIIATLIVFAMEYLKSNTSMVGVLTFIFLIVVGLFSYCFYTDSEEEELE